MPCRTKPHASNGRSTLAGLMASLSVTRIGSTACWRRERRRALAHHRHPQTLWWWLTSGRSSGNARQQLTMTSPGSKGWLLSWLLDQWLPPQPCLSPVKLCVPVCTRRRTGQHQGQMASATIGGSTSLARGRILLTCPRNLYGAPAPEWFAAGITFRIPKDGPPCEANIRPITCVNCVYTSILMASIEEHLVVNSLLLQAWLSPRHLGHL